jgi:acyl-coenzyme A synthetase/AMP-(fatty) acid ligase
VLDEMPVNAVGKVDRVALKQMADAALNRHLA